MSVSMRVHYRVGYDNRFWDMPKLKTKIVSISRETHKIFFFIESPSFSTMALLRTAMIKAPLSSSAYRVDIITFDIKTTNVIFFHCCMHFFRFSFFSIIQLFTDHLPSIYWSNLPRNGEHWSSQYRMADFVFMDFSTACTDQKTWSNFIQCIRYFSLW